MNRDSKTLNSFKTKTFTYLMGKAIARTLQIFMKKKKTFVNTSNIRTTYKFLGEEPCDKMELEINRLLL